MGNRIYTGVFIEFISKDTKNFLHLFQRVIQPAFRGSISFWIESSGLESIRMKSLFAAILSFASSQNRLISDANNLLNYIT